MTKFKAGDRVRRISISNHGGAGSDKWSVRVGDEFVIKQADSQGAYDSHDHWHSNEYLELVEHAPEPFFVDARPQHKRQDILRTAESLIVGDREQDYGKPIDSFRRVAQAMNVVLEGAGHPPIDATTAAKLMIALKLSRLAGGDNKDDTWIDLAGYAALGAEVWAEENQ